MDKQYYQAMAAVEQNHWWFRARRKFIGDAVRDMQLPDHALLAEIGSGTGGNYKLLSGFAEVTALEYSELARSLSICPALPVALPADVPLSTASQDVIVMLDVLEHVENDIESLRVVYDRLKPGGRLLLTVPALMSLWSPHDEAAHHYRRYHKAELTQLMESAGFEIERSRYFNSFLLPGIWLVRVWQRWRAKPVESMDFSCPPKWINSLLEALFSAERLLPGALFVAGVSLLVVAKKPEFESGVSS